MNQTFDQTCKHRPSIHNYIINFISDWDVNYTELQAHARSFNIRSQGRAEGVSKGFQKPLLFSFFKAL